MKKIKSPLPSGKTFIFKQDLTTTQDQIYAACGGMAKGLGVPVILSGGVASDLGGGNVSITSGVAYFEGDFRTFPAYSGVYPVYLQPLAQTTVTRLFNGVADTFYEIDNAEWSTSMPGSGEFITYSFDTESMLNNVQAQLVADNFWEHGWKQVGGVGNIQFMAAAIPFITADLLFYRKDKTGRVWWRGGVAFSAFTGNRGTFLTLIDFSVYPEYSPLEFSYFPISKEATGSVFSSEICRIEGNVTPQFLQVPESATVCSFNFDPINYATV